MIAPRSARDEGVPSPRTIAGHRKWGSDGSAAGGRRSDLSEWQGSARHEPAAPGEVAAGDPNRAIPSFRYAE